MNRPVPIPQIEGVPAALTQAINNRLRTMQQSAGTTQTAQTNAITAPTTGGGTTSGRSGVTTLRIAVTGATTVTPAAAGADGRILVVIVTQGGTGYAVTWAAGYFKFAPPVPTTPNTESICVFAGNSADGLWHLAAAPILGRHI